jgi:hypothetical protein
MAHAAILGRADIGQGRLPVRCAPVRALRDWRALWPRRMAPVPGCWRAGWRLSGWRSARAGAWSGTRHHWSGFDRATGDRCESGDFERGLRRSASASASSDHNRVPRRGAGSTASVPVPVGLDHHQRRADRHDVVAFRARDSIGRSPPPGFPSRPSPCRSSCRRAGPSSSTVSPTLTCQATISASAMPSPMSGRRNV